MDRSEFLAVLEETLKGEIPDYEISGHLQYYDSYIRENDGKTEEEKLYELGEPRLIAKTIMDARMSREGHTSYEESYEQMGSEAEQGEQEQRVRYRSYTWNSLRWYQKLLYPIILLLVLVAFIGIAGIGIRIFFSLVLPVLAVIFIVRWIASMFR